MNGKAALVIGGTSAVEPPLQLGCHERRGTPRCRISFGLDIMVRVQTHGRLALWRRKPAKDGRRAIPCANDANVRALQICEELHNVLCTALHFGCPRGVGTDRLNGNQRFQISKDAGNLSLDLITKRHGAESSPAMPLGCGRAAR
jgi:hypothetical protein